MDISNTIALIALIISAISLVASITISILTRRFSTRVSFRKAILNPDIFGDAMKQMGKAYNSFFGSTNKEMANDAYLLLAETLRRVKDCIVALRFDNQSLYDELRNYLEQADDALTIFSADTQRKFDEVMRCLTKQVFKYLSGKKLGPKERLIRHNKEG